jgi:5'-deoxynucleotidase YfbR-like HD superfamily hydrolase
LIADDTRIEAIVRFLTELEKLKLVYRRSYVSDRSRHENSAEHSWHLALALLTVARESNVDIDVPKALKMSLVHDLGEIDAGDVSIFDPSRASKSAHEQSCISRLAQYDVTFAREVAALWEEYEAQRTIEARWVGVLDRFMPFIVNLVTEGQAWRDQNVSRSQVLAINQRIRDHAPELFRWMMRKIDESVQKGWLRDA